MRGLTPCLLLFAGLALLALPSSAPAYELDCDDCYDRTEANGCASCHINPAMRFVVDQWYTTRKANDFKTYKNRDRCARCHSPFQVAGDHQPLGDYPVVDEDTGECLTDTWQAITCQNCHPPHDLRELWDTPIGNYVAGEPPEVENPDYDPDDPDSGDEFIPNEEAWIAVYEENIEDLCLYCHTGRHGTPEFQGAGQQMRKAGVTCMDCHMANLPTPFVDESGNPIRPQDGLIHNHTFDPLDSLPYSCGTLAGGCHSNKSNDWAEDQILKGKIHGRK